MFDIGTNILALIFVLGVMIFVHEFGHFATAKFFGIRVEVFAFGFGPRLFGFRRGDTDYRVCLLPLGGYVKMKGENPDEELTGADDEYLTRPKYQRFFVLVMGPAMNVVLAYLLFTSVFLAGVDVEAWTEEPPVIGWVHTDSPAAGVDLAPGDRILEVDGEPVETWNELRLRETISGGVPVRLLVERGAGTHTVTVTPRAVGRSNQGYLGISAPFPALVERVEPDTPAAAAGIQPGDRIVGVEGQPVIDFTQVSEVIMNRPGRPTDLTLERAGQTIQIVVTPAAEPTVSGEEIGYLGISRPLVTTTYHFGLIGAARRAAAEVGSQATLVGEILSRLFTGRMSVRTLSGPIEIARYSGAAAESGDPRVMMFFMAVVSLQLGLLNLLPIPVLDGGHITVLLVEGALRRDFSLRVKERLMQVGLVLLVALMAVVITFDVIKSLPVGWTWPF